MSAIIILCLFLGAYVLIKRMFPDVTGLFDWYLAFWIVVLLLVAVPWKYTLAYSISLFTGLF
jgi:hypothetical protein